MKNIVKDVNPAKDHGLTELNVFRYALTLLLVAVKLGVFGNGALDQVSWWIVFLPAYILEIVIGVVAVISIIVGAVLWIGVAIALLIQTIYQNLRKL